MIRLKFGTISGRGAWATIFVVMVGGFMAVFVALIPLAITCKALLYETNRTVRRMVLVNVCVAGWLSAWATLCLEIHPTPWLSDAVNYAILDFYAGPKAFGPVIMMLWWMNVFVLPSTATYILLGFKRTKPPAKPLADVTIR
jgi:hypothetical protein